MTDSSGDAAAKRPDGMPIGKPFVKGQSGNPLGKEVGTISLETRVRRLLEGDDELPEPLVETIKKVCGSNRKAIDAVFIVGVLQALQGDKNWAQFIVERGWGKVAERFEGGDPDRPMTMQITWKDAE